MLQPVEPVLTAHLFGGLHAELLTLLRGLAPEAWERPTRAGAWQVRDVAAHLLDGDLRKLSFHRDGAALPPPDSPIHDYASLLVHLNALNAEWTRVARRIGPRVLTDLLAVTGVQVAEFVHGLDPQARALFPVAWAGEQASANWLDTGREYTERWHHQQQIREAVGAPLLLQREWLFPVLDVSMRALPFAYRDAAAGTGTTVAFEVNGSAGGRWTLCREDDGWQLCSGEPKGPDCRLSLDADTAWRIFFKAIPSAEAAAAVRCEGAMQLVQPFLAALAVMA